MPFSNHRKTATAAVLTCLLFTPLAAHADPLPVSDSVTVAGTGTISPGFPCPTTAPGCTVTLHFTAVFAGDDGVGVTSCTFTGNDVGGTIAFGGGSGRVACDDGSSAAVTFSRIGVVVTLGGTVTHGGITHTIAAGALVFVPLDAAGSSFAVAGEAVLTEGEVVVVTLALPISDTITVAGSGGYSPGFPCPTTAPGCAIHASFSAVMAGDELTVLPTASCTFDGTDMGGTIAAGSGNGWISCNDNTIGSVTFSRVGGVVTLGGTVKLHGTTNHTITLGVLVFVPTDGAGTTFLVGGEMVLVDSDG
jgi:hypothetical protein